MSQLPLFQHGQAVGPAGLETAPLPDGVAQLATQLPPRLRLGTTSWAFPGWIGVLYASEVREKQLVRQGLTAYAKHPLLRTVELDRTYYEPLPAQTYAELAAQVPDDFRFVVKAHEDCTVVRFPPHARYGARGGQRNHRLLDAAYASDWVVGPFMEGLGKKAGPLVFQFSPFEVRSPARFAEKLHDFLRLLPQGPLYAVELRNRELLTAAYGAALTDTKAVHCHNAWQQMPSVLEQRERLPQATRRVLVTRWLTRPGDTHEGARQRYTPFQQLVDEDRARRGELAQLINEAASEGSETFAVVSNNAEGCAPESVRRLAAAISGARASTASSSSTSTEPRTSSSPASSP